MKPPVTKVVANTPKVANTIPCDAMGFTSEILVSIPPENRMMLSASIPMNWAASGLLNWMPNPSLPNNMPTPRNSSKEGRPNRYPALPAKILKIKRMEATKRTSSG